MSTGAKIRYTPAPADVYRTPVWGGLVLPSAGHGLTSFARCDSPHAGWRGVRSDIPYSACDAIDMQPSPTRRQGRSLESP